MQTPVIPSIYYSPDGQTTVGPVSVKTINQLTRAGKVPPNVPVCEFGSTQWEPLNEWRKRHLGAGLQSAGLLLAGIAGALFLAAICLFVLLLMVFFLTR